MIIEEGDCLINESLQVISMVLCLVGLLQVLVGPKKAKESVRFYFGFFSISFFCSLFMLLGLILEAQEGALVHEVLRLVTLLVFLSVYTMTYIVCRAFFSRADPSGDNKEIKFLSLGLKALFALQAVVLVLSYFTGFGFYIDSANMYHRGEGFWLILLMWGIEFLMGLYVLIRYSSSFSFIGRISLWTFAASMVVVFVLQISVSGIFFITILTSVFALLLYIITVSNSTELYYQKEREIDKLKVDIMLSQIQPHFLFNSLTVIKYFCRRDPVMAEKAVVNFSTYLRGNMDSLNTNVPVRFTKELEHTKAYLSIEKLRFDDALQIVYDIQTTRFDLPALTLQPIVENAVRHGIRETEDGRGFTETQYNNFTHVRHEMEKLGLKIPVCHCSNSGAIEDYSDTYCDMVRAGIILYGLAPSGKLQGRLDLIPAMTLKTSVAYVKELKKGATISYGRTFTAEKDMKIATVPIGYADGYIRANAADGYMLINGQKAKIVGRICMDQTMLDVTDLDYVEQGDEVIVFGKGVSGEPTADLLAKNTGTINYEVVCLVGKRVPRIYYKNGVITEVMYKL